MPAPITAAIVLSPLLVFATILYSLQTGQRRLHQTVHHRTIGDYLPTTPTQPTLLQTDTEGRRTGFDEHPGERRVEAGGVCGGS